jgi:hypothetical protein
MYECAQTVCCSFVYPGRAGDVQRMIFWSGIMVGVGIPVFFEGVRDALKKQKDNEKVYVDAEEP